MLQTAAGWRRTGTSRDDLRMAQRQLRDYQARVGQEFPHAGYRLRLRS